MNHKFIINKDGIQILHKNQAGTRKTQSLNIGQDGFGLHAYAMDEIGHEEEMKEGGVHFIMSNEKDWEGQIDQIKMDYEILIETGTSPVYNEIMTIRHLLETGILVAPDYMGDVLCDLFRTQVHDMETRYRIFDEKVIVNNYIVLVRRYNELKKTINFILKAEDSYANTAEKTPPEYTPGMLLHEGDIFTYKKVVYRALLEHRVVENTYLPDKTPYIYQKI